jgi:hypothetical protein
VKIVTVFWWTTFPVPLPELLSVRYVTGVLVSLRINSFARSGDLVLPQKKSKANKGVA